MFLSVSATAYPKLHTFHSGRCRKKRVIQISIYIQSKAYPEPVVRSYPIDIVITQHYYHAGSELDLILGVVRTAGSIFIGTAVLLMIIVIIFFFLKLITPIPLILTGLILLIIIICIGLWLLGKFR